jgi:hypothetical protein
MPATAVPAPMSPPPDPPIYAVLTTPNPSHDDDNVSFIPDSDFSLIFLYVEVVCNMYMC